VNPEQPSLGRSWGVVFRDQSSHFFVQLGREGRLCLSRLEADVGLKCQRACIVVRMTGSVLKASEVLNHL
jgi:hypothetical protein